MRIASSGQIGIGGANYGTDGQVLTSTGASTAPAWEDVGGGGSTSTEVFLSNGTWTNPGVTTIWVTACGAGGGGGGGYHNSGGDNYVANGSGGGSGSVCYAVPVAVSTNITVTVPVKGTGGGSGGGTDATDGTLKNTSSTTLLTIPSGKKGNGASGNGAGATGGTGAAAPYLADSSVVGLAGNNGMNTSGGKSHGNNVLNLHGGHGPYGDNMLSASDQSTGQHYGIGGKGMATGDSGGSSSTGKDGFDGFIIIQW